MQYNISMNGIYDIAIIGAGASGLAAAAAALRTRPGCSVVVLEKNSEAAKKIYATGNGRCNFLNINATSWSYYSSESCEPFVSKVFSSNGVGQILAFFSELGVTPGFEDEEGRLYPRSHQAAAIARALLRGASDAKIKCNFEVASAVKDGSGFVVKSTAGESVRARKLILAGGGKAGIQYGSDGRCFKLAQSLGHRVVKPIPALAPFCCEENLSGLAGVRAGADVFLFADGSLISSSRGEVQFNKDSISGICVMDLSRFMRTELAEKYVLTVDFFAEYNYEELTAELEARQSRFSEKYMLLEGLVPDKLAAYILSLWDGRELSALAELCKGVEFRLTGTKGWPDAQVTSGGLLISEIDSPTMASRLVDGLYFAGEIMDIDGPCGGYNLTWAFASGLCAGAGSAEAL